MASQTYYFSGKAKWAMLMKPDNEYKNYKITVYLDDESMKKFQESGLQLRPKKDDDGYHVTFRCPERKEIKGKIVDFPPIHTIDSEGKLIKEFVGNGSDVTVKVVVYDTKRGKGHRLEAVKVDNLIPYVRDKEEFDRGFNTVSDDGDVPF